MSYLWASLLLVSLAAIAHSAVKDCNGIGDHFCLPEDKCSTEAVNKEAASCLEGSVCCNGLKNSIVDCKTKGGECGTCEKDILPGSCRGGEKCCMLE